MRAYWDAYRVDGLDPARSARSAACGERLFTASRRRSFTSPSGDPLCDEGVDYAQRLSRPAFRVG